MNKFRLIYFLIPPIICIYYCNGSNIGIRLEVIPPCIENEKNAARFGATQLRRLHEQYQVNGTLIVDRTITGPLQMTISIKRCDGRPAKCEESNTLYFDNICKRIAENNPITGDFISKITPEFKCPIQPAAYYLGNGILNFKYAVPFVSGSSLWETTIKVFQSKTQTMVFCSNIDAKFIEYGSKRSRPRRN